MYFTISGRFVGKPEDNSIFTMIKDAVINYHTLSACQYGKVVGNGNPVPDKKALGNPEIDQDPGLPVR